MKKKLRHYWLKFKRDCLSYPIAYLSKYCVRAIMWTCRIDIDGLERFVEVATKEKCILMLWHNRLAIVSEVLNTHAPQFIYAAFISKSRDGEPLAHLANSYKAGRVIRVSHNAKHQALKSVIDNLKSKKEVILFTPDGPRGPCYVVKPGIALAAREVGAAIIPFSWTANEFWALKTWDLFMLPKPFTTIKINFGMPIYMKSGIEIDVLTDQLKHSLQDI